MVEGCGEGWGMGCGCRKGWVEGRDWNMRGLRQGGGEVSVVLRSVSGGIRGKL